MDITLENDTAKSIHDKINKYLTECELSKAEFTVSTDGKVAHLISYKTERPRLGFKQHIGGWFVSRLDIILIAVMMGLAYMLISDRVGSNDGANQKALSESFILESKEYSLGARTDGNNITNREDLVASRCVTNTVSSVPSTK